MSDASDSLFICNFCTNKFGKLITLKKHIFASHILHGCNISCNVYGCPEKLNDKLSLRKHLQKKHSGKTELWTLPKSWYRIVPIHNTIRLHSESEVTGTPIDIVTGAHLSSNDDAISSTCNIHEISAPIGSNCESLGAVSLLAASDPYNSGTSSSSAILLEDVGTVSSVINSSEDKDILFYKHIMANLPKRNAQTAIALCKLKADCQLTEKALLHIEAWAEDLLQVCATTFIGGIKYHVPVDDISPQIKDVFQLGLGLANPFLHVKTEAQRKQILPFLIVSIVSVADC